jgi:hypothetical protein
MLDQQQIQFTGLPEPNRDGRLGGRLIRYVSSSARTERESNRDCYEGHKRVDCTHFAAAIWERPLIAPSEHWVRFAVGPV